MHGGSRKRVVVVGQGYVGLPLAVRAAEVGFDVVGFDTDSARIGRLSAGESYVEDVPTTTLQAALDSGRYSCSDDAAACAGFDVAVITVPTPLRDGAPDLSCIQEAAESLAPHVRPGSCVILESTTYPGTTEELVGPLLERGSGLVAGADFHLGYSPERIDPGNTVWRLQNTPKVISGINAASLAAVRSFYELLVDRTVPVSGLKEAELVKLLENTFRHVNIALVNELAVFAANLGVDVSEAIGAASTKPFGFMPFLPGPGVGGHCLPIDPSYLSWRVRNVLGQSFRFIELANDINARMPDYVIHRLMLALNRDGRALRGCRVLLLGLAYKRNTGDDRESPAMQVADRLLVLGADVRAADPHVVEHHAHPRVRRVDATPDEIAAADVVVVLTDHQAFDLAMVVAHARYALDARHCLPASPNVEQLFGPAPALDT